MIMVQLKTSKERLERRMEQQLKRDKTVLARFNEHCKKYCISDAVTITANEFNLSTATVYNIRRRNA